MSCIYLLHDGSVASRVYVGAVYSHVKTADDRLWDHANSARLGSKLPVHCWLRKHDLKCEVKVLHDLGEADHETVDAAGNVITTHVSYNDGFIVPYTELTTGQAALLSVILQS